MKKLLLLILAVMLSGISAYAQMPVEITITRETFGNTGWDINIDNVPPRDWFTDGFHRVADSATHFKASQITTFTSANGVIRGGASDNSVRINLYDEAALTPTKPEHWREPAGLFHAHLGHRGGWMGSWDTLFFQDINIRGYEVLGIEFGYVRARTHGDDALRWLDVQYRVDNGAWVQIDTTLYGPPTVITRNTWFYIQAPIWIPDGAAELDIRFAAMGRPDEQFYIDDITVRGADISVVHATSITVGSPANAVAVGGTMQMTADVLPANASNPGVAWSVDNTAIATITNTGVLTGVANGNVVVTATSVTTPTVTATKTITVGVPVVGVTAINVSAPNDSITAIGGTLQMAAEVLPADATDKTVTWSVSDTAVATISDTGLLTAVSNGPVAVTATSVQNPAVSGSMTIVVHAPPVGVPSVGSTFALFPVPVVDLLYISSAVGVESVEVFSIDGSRVKTAKLNGSNSVDLSALAAGTYIVRVIKVNGEVVTRSIVKR